MVHTLTAERENALHPEATLSELFERACTAEAAKEREEAAWSILLAATPGTVLKDFCPDSVPSDVLPLLTAAKERACNHDVLDPLYAMRSHPNGAVRSASARALVRLWLTTGEWDSDTARRHVRRLRWGASQEAVEDAINEFSPSDLDSNLRRLKGNHLLTSAWTAPVGFAILVTLVVIAASVGISLKSAGFVGGIGSLLFHIGRMLLRPGSFYTEGRRKRWAPLLARIEEQAKANPEALKSVERELRLLTLRISDQPKDIRDTAARLVRRIEALDRQVGQLPIASAPGPLRVETLPVPSLASEDGDEPLPVIAPGQIAQPEVKEPITRLDLQKAVVAGGGRE